MSWRYARPASCDRYVMSDRYTDRYNLSDRYDTADRYNTLYYQYLNDRYNVSDRYNLSDRYSKTSSRMDEQTTGRHLQGVLASSPTARRWRADCGMGVDCDEVYPGIYIGDAAAAKNKLFLRQMGITHVLNTAEGSRFGQVDTGHSYYRDMPSVRYMGFPMMDQPTTAISRYFYVAAKFIDNAISSGGKILVHCLVGMSRSATCVLAYLMICRKMSAADAIRKVRLCREIRPNDGFLQQLAELDNELRRKSYHPN